MDTANKKFQHYHQLLGSVLARVSTLVIPLEFTKHPRSQKYFGNGDWSKADIYTVNSMSQHAYYAKNGFSKFRQNLTVCAKLVIACILCAGLLACGSENISDLDEYMQEVKARKKGKVPPLPEVKTYETYTYDQNNLRNPFQAQHASRNAAKRNSGVRPNLKRKREALEQYPLDTLKMVGSLEQSGERWALVRAQDGTIFRVKKGNYIGQDNGHILRVSDTAIDLQEIVPDGLGGWIKRKSTLSANE